MAAHVPPVKELLFTHPSYQQKHLPPQPPGVRVRFFSAKKKPMSQVSSQIVLPVTLGAVEDGLPGVAFRSLYFLQQICRTNRQSPLEISISKP